MPPFLSTSKALCSLVSPNMVSDNWLSAPRAMCSLGNPINADALVPLWVSRTGTFINPLAATLILHHLWEVKVIPVVFPMVKHPFVVGFLVAELPLVDMETCEQAQSDKRDNYLSVEEAYSLPSALDKKSWEIQSIQVKDNPVRISLVLFPVFKL